MFYSFHYWMRIGDNMTATEIMEKWLAENQEKPKDLPKDVLVEMLADIMLYKSQNIKAHIPAWVFKETFNVLTNRQ